MMAEKGITLVALVITVIVMLILAGVAISTIAGQDGLFGDVINSTTKYNEAVSKEDNQYKSLQNLLQNYMTDYSAK